MAVSFANSLSVTGGLMYEKMQQLHCTVTVAEMSAVYDWITIVNTNITAEVY